MKFTLILTSVVCATGALSSSNSSTPSAGDGSSPSAGGGSCIFTNRSDAVNWWGSLKALSNCTVGDQRPEFPLQPQCVQAMARVLAVDREIRALETCTPKDVYNLVKPQAGLYICMYKNNRLVNTKEECHTKMYNLSMSAFYSTMVSIVSVANAPGTAYCPFNPKQCDTSVGNFTTYTE
uniref:Secreted protein n=1 Tax=Mucochytrium quahogii TaxID=96639 RepID=A0A7S2W740_9STRA|mmetsp:Transcript_23312/g.37160  ORF Transcript_23312/g.37160 Transcript_23312/m.37160 type:complete len:179 (-) Transcript_23312:232-768(-)